MGVTPTLEGPGSCPLSVGGSTDHLLSHMFVPQGSSPAWLGGNSRCRTIYLLHKPPQPARALESCSLVRPVLGSSIVRFPGLLIPCESQQHFPEYRLHRCPSSFTSHRTQAGEYPQRKDCWWHTPFTPKQSHMAHSQYGQSFSFTSSYPRSSGLPR